MKNMRCPYCKSPVRLRSAEGIYQDNKTDAQLYVCGRYPACDAYVRCHPGTTIPMGTLADGKLRRMRMEAHRWFELMCACEQLNKRDAYDWLARLLYVPRSQAHIGYLGEYYCQSVMDECKKNRRAQKSGCRNAAAGICEGSGRWL